MSLSWNNKQKTNDGVWQSEKQSNTFSRSSLVHSLVSSACFLYVNHMRLTPLWSWWGIQQSSLLKCKVYAIMLDISDLVKDCKFQGFFWVWNIIIKSISIAIIMLCHCALKVCHSTFKTVQFNLAQQMILVKEKRKNKTQLILTLRQKPVLTSESVCDLWLHF